MEIPAAPPTPAFEQLPLARADIIIAPAGHYRVYSDHKSFKLVEADSAVHALESSGLAQAFKIERELMYNVSLIFPNFAKETPAQEPAAPSTPS